MLIKCIECDRPGESDYRPFVFPFIFNFIFKFKCNLNVFLCNPSEV